jgi:hypothetical protein
MSSLAEAAPDASSGRILEGGRQKLRTDAASPADGRRALDRLASCREERLGPRATTGARRGHAGRLKNSLTAV